jgi:hypothetical protein
MAYSPIAFQTLKQYLIPLIDTRNICTVIVTELREYHFLTKCDLNPRSGTSLRELISVQCGTVVLSEPLIR